MARAFPELVSSAQRRLARGAWQHLGMVVAEVLGALRRPLADTLAILEFEGREHLDAAVAAHGRALLLTAHLGNWEFLCAAHALTGRELVVVVRPLDAPSLNGLAEGIRRKFGATVVAKRDAVRPVLEALRTGRSVAVLLDQNTARPEGVFVPFFDRPASTSRSLAVLSLRTGLPVVPVFTWRLPSGRHRVHVRPPITPMPGLPRQEAVAALTARYTAAVEAAIRQVPEQWLWMHHRWRTRPDGTCGG